MIGSNEIAAKAIGDTSADTDVVGGTITQPNFQHGQIVGCVVASTPTAVSAYSKIYEPQNATSQFALGSELYGSASIPRQDGPHGFETWSSSTYSNCLYSPQNSVVRNPPCSRSNQFRSSTQTLSTSTAGQRIPQNRDAVNGVLKLLHKTGEIEWAIDKQVYSASTQVIAALYDRDIPAPQVVSHGPNSVVFTWEHEANNLYLTVTGNAIAVLISDADGRKQRGKLPTPNFGPGVELFRALESIPKLPSKNY